VSSRPGDAMRAGSAWHGTMRWRARRARAARQRQTNTPPREPYDGFREKLQRTQLRRAASRMSDAVAARDIIDTLGAPEPGGLGLELLRRTRFPGHADRDHAAWTVMAVRIPPQGTTT
jgi:hypothetical protein